MRMREETVCYAGHKLEICQVQAKLIFDTRRLFCIGDNVSAERTRRTHDRVLVVDRNSVAVNNPRCLATPQAANNDMEELIQEVQEPRRGTLPACFCFSHSYWLLCQSRSYFGDQHLHPTALFPSWRKHEGHKFGPSTVVAADARRSSHRRQKNSQGPYMIAPERGGCLVDGQRCISHNM